MSERNPIGWPESSAAHYCKRLATISRPILQRLQYSDRKFIADYLTDVLLKDPDPDLLPLMLYKDPPLQARLAVVTEYTTSKWVLEQELKARGVWPLNPDGSYCHDSTQDAFFVAAKNPTVGLCISGGGIRSATFALGVLQGLARIKLLGHFHYLSSVSGGGYIHQFLATWIKRTSLENVQTMMDPLPNASHGNGGPDPTYATVQPEPIRWLRRYSNYLTPQKGLFSADTWTLVAIVIRNAGLNLLTLVSCLLAVLILPHIVISPRVLVFVRQRHLLDLSPFSKVHIVDMSVLLSAILIGTVFAACFFWPTINFAKGIVEKPRSYRSLPILCGALAPIILAVIASTPSAYRSIVRAQPYTTESAPSLFSEDRDSLRPHPHDIISTDKSYSAHTVDYKPNTSFERLNQHWSERPHFPIGSINIFHSLSSLRSLDLVFAVLVSFGFAVVVCLSLPRVRLYPDLWLLLLIPLLFGIVPGAAILLLYCLRIFMFSLLFFVLPNAILPVSAIFIPLLLLGIPFVVLEITIGLIGSELEDAQREWLARFRAFSFLSGMLWLGFGGFSLLGPFIVVWIGKMALAKYALLGTWITTSLAGVLAGQSPKTDGKNLEKDSTKVITMERIALIAPPVFVGGLLLLLSGVADLIIKAVSGTIGLPLITTSVVSLAIALLFGWRVDINDFSMQPFYRDRLARGYAGASDPARTPDKFTGFSGEDRSRRVADLLPRNFGHSDKALWKKTGGNYDPVPPNYEGPFPIFCTSINLTMGEDLAYQERKAACFAFTPLYSGYSVGYTESAGVTQQFNGFVPTVDYAYSHSGGISIASAVATSGAAVSPNSGYHTNAAVAFLLTMFNVRLGWWIRNPRYQSSKAWPSSPIFGLLQLLNELRGSANDASRYVYLTDGGHFDNMGLYELVRRRCRTIVICDAEQDCLLQFDGLAQSARKIRLDFGVDIDLKDIRYMKRDETNPGHMVVGTITYPEDPANPGNILYIKTSLDGDEPVDIVSYKREDPAFPQDTTLDQFFTESKFESYRALGAHIAMHPNVVAKLQEYIG